MRRAAISARASADLVKWFGKLDEWMRCEKATFDSRASWFQDARAGAILLEMLTDSSNELAACALVSMHLRRTGPQLFRSTRKRAEHFWVRSEWSKWDISFGWASSRFADWDHAWTNGVVEDLGYLEAKVIYGHYSQEKKTALIAELASQLEHRRGLLTTWGRAPAWVADRAFGGLLFWVGPPPATAPGHQQLVGQFPWLAKVDWRTVATFPASEMRKLWPRDDLGEVALTIGLHVPEAS